MKVVMKAAHPKDKEPLLFREDYLTHSEQMGTKLRYLSSSECWGEVGCVWDWGQPVWSHLCTVFLTISIRVEVGLVALQ